VAEGGNVRFEELRNVGWRSARRRVERTAHKFVRVLRKNLAVCDVRIVEEEKIPGEAVLVLHGGSVDLRDPRIKPAIASAYNQRPLLPDGISQTGAGGEVAGIEGNFARIRPQWVGNQAFGGTRSAGRNASLD